MYKPAGSVIADLAQSYDLHREALRACRDNRVLTNILKILSKYPVKILGYLYK